LTSAEEEVQEEGRRGGVERKKLILALSVFQQTTSDSAGLLARLSRRRKQI
jgi:hypothetical protein